MLGNKVEQQRAQLSLLQHKVEDELLPAHKANDRIDSLEDKLADLQHRIAINSAPPKSATAGTVVNSTVSDNHSFDLFYKKFEDKFRGNEQLIKDRVAEHIHYFQSLPPNLRDKPVVDIGCGRGEFLSTLKDNGISALGVDMNAEMVERANKLGLKATQSDALTYLSAQKPNSLSAITGFHIVEHIPFEPLMAIFAECYRTIARGGFVLFETPNPRSLSVGANTFYLDPSHIRPVPPELLAFMLEYVGFSPHILELHRTRPQPKGSNSKTVTELHETVFGYADYAVVAKKTWTLANLHLNHRADWMRRVVLVVIDH
jgi:O-antigen chain-terminating methyltransferase